MKFRHYPDALPHQLAMAGWLQRYVLRIFAAPLSAIFGRIIRYHWHKGIINSHQMYAMLANTDRALWQRESGKYKVPRLVRRRVYFTMIEHPFKGWIRVGKAYGTRKAAQGRMPFVRKAWRGLRGKVSSCSLTWREGKLDAASVKRLDSFNMDAPDDSANDTDEAPL